MSDISISREEAKNVKDWLDRLKNTKNKYGNKKDCVITIIDDFDAYDDDLDMFIKALEYMQKLEKIEHELYHCDEVAQNECDAYCGRCNQCKVERIEQIVKG